MNNYINNNIDFNKINAQYQDDKKHIKIERNLYVN